MSWPATFYHLSLPGGQSPGSLSIESGSVLLAPRDGDTLTMPLEELDIKFAGFNNQQALLAHPLLPGWTVLCTEAGFLSAPEILHHQAHGSGARKAIRARSKIPWPVKVSLCLMAVCLLAMGYIWVRRDAITAGIAEKIPVSLEKQIGESLYKDVQRTEKSSNDAAMQATVDAVTTRLLKGVTDKRYEFTFHIVDNDAVNAFAIPGGHVVIHSALLKAAKRPEEIAGVLAHEIAHITKRHSLRNVISSVGTTAIIRMLAGDTSTLASASGQMLELTYSRDFEREADDAGWQYLIDANIDPRGMIDFFKSLESQETGGIPMDGVMKIMSTHPATGERIRTLEEKAKALGDHQWEPIKTTGTGA